MNTKLLRSKLLSLAIRGRLVHQDPNDEPASALLHRINPKAAPLNPDDAPFDVPDSWCWVRLKDICTKIVDGDHNPPKGEKAETPYIMASSTNINNDTLVDLSKVRYLSEELFKKADERTKVRKGDVLITTVGTLGRSCVYEGELNLTFQRSVSIISTLSNNYYLKYYFDSKYIQDKFINEAKGTAQRGFYINQLSALLIPLPPLAEQERIVNEVERWFACIEQLERSREALGKATQQTKRTLLSLAIAGRLVPQCPSDEPASELLRRINPKATPITEEIPFDIPNNWCWCKVGDIVQINPKNDCPDDTMAAFIPMEKVEATYGSQYTYDEIKWGSIKKGYTHFADGDVAFAKITPCFQNRKSAVFKDLPNGIGAGTTELKVLRPYSETLNRWYLLYFLKSSYFIAEAKFKGTANQQRIVKGYLENKMFPLPPLAEQERIVGKVEELFAVLDSLR